MTRDQALSKIKKCLALAKSPNPHEAAAAMRQAQKLMAEHALSELAISMSDVSEARVWTVSQASNQWEVNLMNAVARAFGCEYFTSWESKLLAVGQTQKRVVVFVGIGVAPKVAEYAYEVLSRQCAKARLDHVRKQPKTCKPITRTARGDQFALGWANGVRSVLTYFANSDADQWLLDSYMAAEHPDLVTEKSINRAIRNNVSNADYVNGVLSGRNARLQRGVGAAGTSQGLLT